MRARLVFFRLIITTVICCFLIYAAGQLGHGVSTTLIGARIRDSALSPMHVLLIDYSRGLSIERHIMAPHAIRADWEASPPEVLMRLVESGEVTFKLHRIDLGRLRLESLVTHRVPAEPRPRDLEVVFAGQRAGVYSPATGDVTMIDRALSTSTRVSVTENSNEMVMAWSPDGSLLAVKDYRAAQLALLDGTSIRLIGTFRNAAPVWLPDNRSMLLAQDSFVGRNGRILILDTVTGEANPYTVNLVGRSAAACGTNTLGYVFVQPDRAITLQTLDLVNGEMTVALDAGRIGTQDVFWLAFAPRIACDWMLIQMRHPNEPESRLYRLHLLSGELTHLGDNVRILEINADAVIYESTTARTAFTVRRAAFDVGSEPEVFGRIPAQYQTILWLDGYRRGVFLRDGQLWSIDLTTGTTPILALPVRLQDIQLVTQEEESGR